MHLRVTNCSCPACSEGLAWVIYGRTLSRQLVVHLKKGASFAARVAVVLDRSFAVAHVAYEIYWMRKHPGTGRPRLLFFINEIGGGGGKQALFPSFPYECAAKWGLNYLLRQGRAFGVCCVFATQNPGDVDYKGLSNCGTWMVGKLATDRDRKKVLEGLAVWGPEAERVKHNLVSADTGDFVVRTPGGDVAYIRERWLLTYHRVLTMDEVSRVCGRK